MLQEYGIRVEPPRSGSHWKAWNDQVSYRIPAHNGLKEEISDVYLRKLCKTFGLDFDTFRAKL